MKKLINIALLIVISTCAAVAQNSKDEQEVRSFLAEYDKAVSSRDIAFLERALSDDYVFTGASGRMSDRIGALKFFMQQRDKPTYRMNSLKHENVKARVVGKMAVVTNDYTAETTPIDSPDAEPQITKGRHTRVLEKRKGRWMVIAEQDTEQARDDKLMEQQVLKAGRRYLELIKRLNSGRSYAELETSGDIAELKHLLADEYTYTTSAGEISNKGEELEWYKTPQIKLESVELSEQKVRVINNGTAVETGKIRYIGTNAGKPFDFTKRYTTTWIFWGYRWQIIADHASAVKE